MGPCNSGYWESPAASPVGLNGRSRYRGSQGRVPGGVCIFPISVWSGMACRRKRLAVLLEAVQCSYLVSEKSVRRRTSFLGNHDTFWRSSLPRRALQTRARRLAREGPSFTVRTCTTAGGRKWGTLPVAKQRPVRTSWDTYRPFRTPGARPRNYFRNVRHLISAPVSPCPIIQTKHICASDAEARAPRWSRQSPVGCTGCLLATANYYVSSVYEQVEGNATKVQTFRYSNALRL